MLYQMVMLLMTTITVNFYVFEEFMTYDHVCLFGQLRNMLLITSSPWKP